ncbi:MAG TPA: hypothetical protein VKN99_02725 [Polyangia bacterium]|nr:hypothetical protein [Polyangia bacterium]
MKTTAQLAKWLAEVGVALRYGQHKSLPIASTYEAVGDQRRATELTNALIAEGTAVEIVCVAERVALAHATLVPALLALRRRGRAVDELELSDTARGVLAFVASEARPTAGQVRAHLGVPPQTWPNPADDALAELQRWLVLDRGATDVPGRGLAYLPKEGIPYRLVDEAHPTHVRAARKLTVAKAAQQLLDRYLAGAGEATTRQLGKLFGLLVSAAELDDALAALVRRKRIALIEVGRDRIAKHQHRS